MKKACFGGIVICIFALSSYSFQATLQFRESNSTFRALYFVTADIGYAAGTPSWDHAQNSNSGSVFRTSDGGRSWNKLNAGSDVAFSDIHFTSTTTGHAVGSQGTVISTGNSGSSWFLRRLDTGYDLTSIYFLDHNRGWISGKRRGGVSGNAVKIWYTTNAGASWQEGNFPSEAEEISDVIFVNSLRGWAAGSRRVAGALRGAVYTTSDGGRTWTHQFSPGHEITFSAVSFTDANNGWVTGVKTPSASAGAHTIFNTSDGGRSWQSQSITTNLHAINFIDSQRGYAAGPRISGGQPSVFRTLNGGQTWTRFLVDRQTGEAVFAIHLTSGRAVLAGEHGFISINESPWRSDVSENAMTFSSYQIGDRYRFDAVHFIDELRGWVGGTHVDFEHGNQIVLHTSDGGNSWREVFERDTFCMGFGRRFSRVRDLHVFGDRSAVAAAGLGSHWCDPQSSYLLFSGNAALGWQSQTDYRQAQLFALHAIDRNNIWFLPELRSGDPLRLLFTSDMGRTFTMRTFPSLTVGDVQHGDIFFYDSRNGWVAAGGGFVARTTDGGQSWQRSGQGVISGRMRAVHFVSQSRGWVGGENLYETSDGGASWQIRDMGFSGDIHDIAFTSPTHGWAVGDNGVIRHTTNGGQSWISETPPRSNYIQLSSISMINDTVGWAVGGAGFIIKVQSGQSSSIRVHGPAAEKSAIVSILAANSSLQLSFDVTQRSEVSLSLINFSGRVIHSLTADISPNNQQLSINTGAISSGMYILSYTLDGISYNQRVLIR